MTHRMCHADRGRWRLRGLGNIARPHLLLEWWPLTVATTADTRSLLLLFVLPWKPKDLHVNIDLDVTFIFRIHYTCDSLSL